MKKNEKYKATAPFVSLMTGVMLFILLGIFRNKEVIGLLMFLGFMILGLFHITWRMIESK